MDLREKQQYVRDLVRTYLNQNGSLDNLGVMFQNDAETLHIVETGTSILMTKWNVGYPGGGFVQAVVDNDLRGAIGRADYINSKALKFYVQLMYNVGMPNAIMD